MRPERWFLISGARGFIGARIVKELVPHEGHQGHRHRLALHHPLHWRADLQYVGDTARIFIRYAEAPHIGVRVCTLQGLDPPMTQEAGLGIPKMPPRSRSQEVSWT